MSGNVPATVELLSPAGDWQCVHAAVENGADAIYFGLDAGWNARARAKNFSLNELPRLMEYLHLRGVRGYVTLNTLVFSNELTSVESHVQALANARVDALLVQDLGAADLIRATCPDLDLHASTQMTLTSPSAIQFARSLGIRRVVLPRELSLTEIQSIREEIPDIALEAFVHGALCVAYSGQCLTSESLGGRSANRGQCAQACRLPYEVICDGQDIDLADVKYLLSPQDLAGYHLVPDLLAAGVSCLKIEGRLKTPEYVANVTHHYRQALDAALQECPFQLTEIQREELELSFSRGFSPGWLNGCDHKMLVPGISSAKQGVRIGVVRCLRGRRLIISLDGRLRVGDGIVLSGNRESGSEWGGRVTAVYQNEERITETVDQGDVAIELHGIQFGEQQIHPGQEVWKTDDPQLTRRLRTTYRNNTVQRRVPLDLVVTARAGERLHVAAHSDNGRTCDVLSEFPLAVATRNPATTAVLRDKLGRLGDTVYSLRNLDATIEGQPMIPFSVLGSIRKQLIEGLGECRPELPPVRMVSGQLESMRAAIANHRPEPTESLDAATSGLQDGAALHVMCRHAWQVQPVLDAGAQSIYLEFADLRQYADAIALGRSRNATVWVATPRIEKPGETGVFKAIEKSQPDGVLVRNLGGLLYFHQRSFPTVADFSLNAANELTVAKLRAMGCQRVTASYDLDRDQLADLLAVANGRDLEIVIHQHMPMFHMEHCVFCAVLSPGTNRTNCGRPCDDHDVQLRDRVGAEHYLHADIGCRNTLYNAVPQSAAESFQEFSEKGARNFRVELLESNVEQTHAIVTVYQRLLAGSMTGREVWKKLRATNRVGLTRGTMESQRDPLAII